MAIAAGLPGAEVYVSTTPPQTHSPPAATRSTPPSPSPAGCWRSSTATSCRASSPTRCPTSATSTSASRRWSGSWSAWSRCCATSCCAGASRAAGRPGGGELGGGRPAPSSLFVARARHPRAAGRLRGAVRRLAPPRVPRRRLGGRAHPQPARPGRGARRYRRRPRRSRTPTGPRPTSTSPTRSRSQGRQRRIRHPPAHPAAHRRPAGRWSTGSGFSFCRDGPPHAGNSFDAAGRRPPFFFFFFKKYNLIPSGPLCAAECAGAGPAIARGHAATTAPGGSPRGGRHRDGELGRPAGPPRPPPPAPAGTAPARSGRSRWSGRGHGTISSKEPPPPARGLRAGVVERSASASRMEFLSGSSRRARERYIAAWPGCRCQESTPRRNIVKARSRRTKPGTGRSAVHARSFRGRAHGRCPASPRARGRRTRRARGRAPRSARWTRGGRRARTRLRGTACAPT